MDHLSPTEDEGHGAFEAMRSDAPRQKILLDVAWMEEYASSEPSTTTYAYFVDAVLPACVTAVGVLGNALALAVYMRKRNQSPTTVYLISLMLADIILLISYFFCSAAWIIYFKGFVQAYGPHTVIVHITYVINNMSMTAGIWITAHALLSVQRIPFGRWWFGHNKLTSGRSAMVTTGIITVLAVIFNIPKIFELQLRSVPMKDMVSPIMEELHAEYNHIVDFEQSNETLLMLGPSALSNSIYFVVYRIVCRCIFDTIATLIIIAAPVRMMWFVQKINQITKSSSRSRRFSGWFNLDDSPAVGVAVRPDKTAMSLVLLCSGKTDVAVLDQQPQLVLASTSRNPTIPLGVFVAKFLASHFLLPVVTVLELVKLSPEFHNDYLQPMIFWTNFLVVLNSATNGLMLLFWDKGSRDAVREVTKRITRRQRSENKYEMSAKPSVQIDDV